MDRAAAEFAAETAKLAADAADMEARLAEKLRRTKPRRREYCSRVVRTNYLT